ncbi:SETMR methyltransferase, partial [Acromyrmex insinuator]
MEKNKFRAVIKHLHMKVNEFKRGRGPSKPAPKKVKIVKSVGNVMATQMINGDYYAALLDRFNNILKKKRPHLTKKKVLSHQNNARVHTCPAPMAKFNEFRYELLPHPAYLSDLASCDYFLFRNLKKWFGGKRFTTRKQLIAEIEVYFEGLDKLFGRLKKVGESLDQVYRAERRLC